VPEAPKKTGVAAARSRTHQQRNIGLLDFSMLDVLERKKVRLQQVIME
jgi:hypothetical protein